MKAADLFSLKGRVALVTGASSGLGTQFAKALADNGAAVALVARRADRLAAVKQAIEAAGGRAIAIEADVTDRTAITLAFDAAEKAFGTVTILVNNAGIAQSSKRAVEVTAEEWRKVLSVDLDGVFYVAQQAARRMLSGNGGVILNMGSTSGMNGYPNYADYNCAKAGVIELTRTMALELAPTIRAIAVCPGYVWTSMQEAEYTPEMKAAVDAKIPLRRHATTAEIAALFAFLASDEAPYITGHPVIIDGGEIAGGLASR
jgi:NAD(P)-dependent dehydrogenase (short-subunit alcohol dehydrogenase family)